MTKNEKTNPLGPAHADSIQRSKQEPKAATGFSAPLGSTGPVLIMNQRKDQPEQKK